MWQIYRLTFSQNDPSVIALFLPLQGAAIMVSLSIFSVGSALDFVEDPSGATITADPADTKSQFLLNTHTLAEINQILLNAADVGYSSAGPVLLAWSTILKALNIRVEGNKAAHAEEIELERFNRRPSNDTNVTLSSDPYEDVINMIMGSVDDQNPLDFMAQTAINHCQTLEILNGFTLRLGNTADALFSHRTGAMMRIVILDFIKSLRALGLDYGAEIVEPFLSSLLGGQNYWDIADSTPLNAVFDPIAAFLDDDVLIAAFLEQAMSRYPYEVR